MQVQLKANGQAIELDASPGERLIDLLRDRLQLRGTKESCGKGHCGSCLVFLDGNLVNACLVPAFRLNGADVVTIEGFSRTKEFAAIEKAFADILPLQCGLCTSGLVMATGALLHANTRPSESQIRQALAGNLCRCTGYRAITEAVMSASELWGKRGYVRRG